MNNDLKLIRRLTETLEDVTSLRRPGSLGRTIFISVLLKLGLRVWVEFVWPRIRFNDRLLNPAINLRLQSKTGNCFTSAALLSPCREPYYMQLINSSLFLINNEGMNNVT